MAWSLYWQQRPTREKDTECWKFWEKPYPVCKYIESLTSPKKVLHIFAHNVFFDLQVSQFFYYFTQGGWKLDFVYENGMVYILVIHKDKATIKLISTTNYFQASVKELGAMVGLPKLECDPLSAPYQQVKAYCKRDVEIIFRVMQYYIDFIRSNDLGRFSMTRASQAFNAYRHRFMNNKISLHDYPEVRKLERDAYMGGRVECFRLGKQSDGPFVSLDINSMYPFIMKDEMLPCRLRNYWTDISIGKTKELMKKYCGVAEIEVSTEEPVYPVRRDNKLIFPVGEFSCFVNTPALLYALKHKHVKRIRQLATYDRAILFKEYVEYLYSLRQKYQEKGDKIMSELAKYLMNSLYGKFAQKKRNVDVRDNETGEMYCRIDNYDIVTGEKWITYMLMNKIVTEQEEGNAPNTLISISSHIAEHGRMLLWSIMKQIGLHQVIYCDTDSIKISEKHIDLIRHPISENTLGDLKIEEKFNKFHVWGPKSYKTERIRKIKGVPKSAKSIGDLRWIYPSFLGQKTHMKEREPKRFLVRYIVKEATGIYDKGIVLSDGQITPFRLSLPY